MITVYLDSADYSAFGDVERGVGRADVALLYDRLSRFAEQGVVRFAYSMPILSELLQYDASYPETALAKARAVERLCGNNAFIWPVGLIGNEIAASSREQGWTDVPAPGSVLSTQARWFPNVETSLATLKADFQKRIDDMVAGAVTANRKQKRTVEARARRLSIPALAAGAIPELSERYGLRPHDIRQSVVAVLEDRIKPAEGARRLFSAIAEPTAFIQCYFVRHRGEKDFPNWMRDFGLQVEATLIDMRARLSHIVFRAPERKQLRAVLASMAEKVATRLVELGQDEARSLGVPDDALAWYQFDPAAAQLLACRNVMKAVIVEFFLVNIGAAGGGYHSEQSAGGDIFHSLYLPHCDLWRTDRRFGHLVRGALPAYRDRVVTKLANLPAAIDRLSRAS